MACGDAAAPICASWSLHVGSEAEAAENWEREYQIGEPYISESEGDSVLSEREAAHSEAESVLSGEREVARSESEAEDGRWHDDDDRESDEDK